MKKKILIIVDNGTRDLLPSKLLEKKLVEFGCDARCCSKRDFILNFREFNPDGCVVPRGDWPFVKPLAQHTKVFIMPSEGARLTPETMLSVFIGRLHSKDSSARLDQNNNIIENFHHISKVFLWGPQSKKFLMDSGYFKEEQLIISGNSRLDIYRNTVTKTTRKEFTIGVAFSAKAASMFDGNYEYAKILHDLNEKSHLPLVPDGCHWEDYAWRDFAILRQMMWLIKRIMLETKHKVLIRVGPLENREDLVFLQNRYPGRIIIQERSEQLFDFLKNIDCLLTCWSTTGIEAQLMNIPTIGIPYLINKEKLLAHVKPEANGFNTFLQCYHTPESLDEAMRMIYSCEKGDLPVSKDEGFFKEFIHNVYFWPSSKSATSLIAETIREDIKNSYFRNSKNFDPTLRLPEVFEKILKFPLIPQYLVFQLLFVLRKLKNLQLDMSAGSYSANRAFYSSKNPNVLRLVKQTTI